MTPSSLQIVTWGTVVGAVASALTLAASEPAPADCPLLAGRAMVDFVPHRRLDPAVARVAPRPRAGAAGEERSRAADPAGRPCGAG